MKVVSLFALASSIASASACLRVHGSIIYSDHAILNAVWFEDNGQITCDSGRGWSYYLAGWNIGCIGGYSASVSSDGIEYTYNTPHGNYRWRNVPAMSGSAKVLNHEQFC